MTHQRMLIVLVAVLSLIAAGPAQAQFWEVDGHYFTPHSQSLAQTGSAVAIGDFDNDGIADLVYGASGWDNGTGTDGGWWRIHWGRTNRTLPIAATYTFTGTDNGLGGYSLAAGDFDGDGRDEIAIGRPRADVDSGGLQVDAGQVWIMDYNGASWSFPLVLSQADTTISGPEPNDWFGTRLAVGNFNNDAYDDLVVGTPYEDWVSDVDAGVVHVFFGSASGLRTDNDVAFVAGNGGVLGTRTTSDRLGFALATGDFNDDGFDDIAMGAPYRDPGGVTNAGQVHIVRGSAGGVTLTGQQLLSDNNFAGSDNQVDDNFGYSLAAANFDQGGILCITLPCYDDLAIGVPGQMISGQSGAGKTLVAYGGASGVQTTGESYISQTGNSATPEVDDNFGRAVAAGYADRSGTFLFSYADLVVGTPFEDYTGGISNEGYVHLFFGAGGGVDSAQQEQAFNQKPGFPSAPPANADLFGSVMAIGDLDDDGWGDLVVGMPVKDPGGVNAAGGVLVLYGALFADGFESSGVANW